MFTSPRVEGCLAIGRNIWISNVRCLYAIATPSPTPSSLNREHRTFLNIGKDFRSID